MNWGGKEWKNEEEDKEKKNEWMNDSKKTWKSKVVISTRENKT